MEYRRRTVSSVVDDIENQFSSTLENNSLIDKNGIENNNKNNNKNSKNMFSYLIKLICCCRIKK